MNRSDNPSEPAELLRRMLDLHRRGEHREAATVGSRLEELLDRNPGGVPASSEAEVLDALGLVRLHAGDPEGAISCHRRVLAILEETVGEEEALARCLHNLAEAERILRNDDEAEASYRRAIEIWQKAPDKYRIELASTLRCWASLKQGRRQLAESEELLLEARELWQEVEGRSRDRRYASLLGDLGKLHHLKGHYRAARDFLARSVAIRRRALGADHTAVAAGEQDLAIIEEQLGHHRRAAELYEKALGTLRRTLGEKHPDVAKVLSNFAELQLTTGRVPEAEEIHRQAHEIKLEALGEDHPGTAVSRHNLAHVHFVQGDYEQALLEAERASTILRRELGEAHTSTLASRELIGEIHLAAGRFRDAEDAFRTALEARRAVLGSEHPDVAKSLHPLANLYRVLGSDEEATRLCRQALDLQRRALGDDHPEIALSLHNLANVLVACGDLDQATEVYGRALEIWESVLGEDHAHTVSARHNLGDLHRKRGDLETAGPLLVDVLRRGREIFGREHPSVYRTLLALAEGLVAAGDYRRASRAFRRVLDNWRQRLGPVHPDLAQVWSQLALSRAGEGSFETALEHLREAQRIDDLFLADAFAITSDRQRLSYLEILGSRLDRLLTVVVAAGGGNRDAVAMAFESVLKRKALASEALVTQRQAVLGGRHRELAPKLEALTVLELEIARRSWAGPGPTGLEEHLRELDRLREQGTALEAELARRIPEVGLQRQLREVDLAAVAAALPRGGVLVEIVLFRSEVLRFGADQRQRRVPRYLAFVLREGEAVQPAMVELGSAETIDREIENYRREIGGAGSLEREVERRSVPRLRDTGTGERLRRRVIQPLEPFLEGRTRLIIAPDGDLGRLPFETLPLAAGNTLLDRFEVSYLSTGRDLIRLRMAVPPEAKRPPLVVADPDFDLGVSEKAAGIAGTTAGRRAPYELSFQRLPGTLLEGRWVANYLGAEPWLQAEALEGRLKEHRSPKILHLATHGFFLDDPDSTGRREESLEGARSRHRVVDERLLQELDRRASSRDGPTPSSTEAPSADRAGGPRRPRRPRPREGNPTGSPPPAGAPPRARPDRPSTTRGRPLRRSFFLGGFHLSRCDLTPP